MKNKIKIIAEIGWNHLGKIDLAKKMIDSAKLNGADATLIITPYMQYFLLDSKTSFLFDTCITSQPTKDNQLNN